MGDDAAASTHTANKNGTNNNNDDEKSESFTVHASVSEIVDRYDGFVLDQFGVLHDGHTGLPGAAACVRELKRHKNKKLIILSNSSALASSTLERLDKFDLDRNDFVGAVTSGEEAALHIRQKYASDERKRKKQQQVGLFLTWATPKNPSPALFLEHCGGVPITDDAKMADFVLLHGCEVLRGSGHDGVATETSLGDYMKGGDTGSVIEPLLKECLARRLPMVCANPDFKMVNPDGTISRMPGGIAKLYEELGGVVESFGKPNIEHFEACIRDLGLPRHRVVHVGDSLHHDVAGANAAGIDSLFVAAGIHRDELEFEPVGDGSDGELPSRDSLRRLFATHGQTPTHVVPMLRY